MSPPGEFYFALHAFDNNFWKLTRMSALEDSQKKLAVSKLKHLAADGSTVLITALNEAGYLLKAFSPGCKDIIMFTDGDTNDPQHLGDALAHHFKASGVTLSVAVLDDGQNLTGYRRMTSETGGFFVRSSQANQFIRLVQKAAKAFFDNSEPLPQNE